MITKSSLAIIFVFFSSTHAHAYLDPGIGSIIIQGIIAALAATSLTIKIYWQKIRNFLRKKTEKKTEKKKES